MTSLANARLQFRTVDHTWEHLPTAHQTRFRAERGREKRVHTGLSDDSISGAGVTRA